MGPIIIAIALTIIVLAIINRVSSFKTMRERALYIEREAKEKIRSNQEYMYETNIKSLKNTQIVIDHYLYLVDQYRLLRTEAEQFGNEEKRLRCEQNVITLQEKVEMLDNYHFSLCGHYHVLNTEMQFRKNIN